MTQLLHPAAQHGFSAAAELYQQVRPSYPQEIHAWLTEQLHLNANSRVIDLASGTGKFLPYLIPHSGQLTAIEPVTEMLAQLKLAYPLVETLQAFSDHMPLPSQSIDAVLSAQAFHWFANLDSLKEIHRVLKPQGHLGLVWNQRDTQVDWVNALAERLAPLEEDTPRYHSGLWKKVFEHQHVFQLKSLHQFAQQQTGTVEQVVSKRLLSTSFIAAMPLEQQQDLKHQFEQIVLQYTGKQPQDEISFPYITYAYHFQKIAE